MVELSSVSFSYGKHAPHAIDEVSFRLDKGKIAVLLGPNGAGKTTLLKLILGLYRPLSGSISIAGKSVSKMSLKEKSRLLAYVPQTLALPPLSVFETILLGRLHNFSFTPTSEDKRLVIEAANKLGIAELLQKSASELSGGEMQKVALARAFVQGSEILLFDEPTSNLDIAARMLTLDLARLSAKEGKTVILAIHDINDGLSVGDRFLFLKKGMLLANGGKEIFTETNLDSLYGVKCHIENINNQMFFAWENRK